MRRGAGEPKEEEGRQRAGRWGPLKREYVTTASAWTADRIARLQTLWREGRTAEQIALELQSGISRSAVLGKVYRMGLSYGVRAPREKAGPRARPEGVRRSLSPPTSSPVRPPLPETEERGAATLMTVLPKQCRWPLGDPLMADFSLCGGPVLRGAYCARHAGVAYRRATETGMSLERLAGLN